jgi:valyl-tRNA synthetase
MSNTRQAMATAYDPSGVEERWYSTWVERGYFRAGPTDGKEPFCIVMPPPNVTGELHMGHAFEHTLQDAIIRRKRMQGFEALWLPGTDHAGIGTERLVRQQLQEERIDPRVLGRDGFVERVWRWKDEYGNRIVEQMQRLGNSCDWDRLRFTMDEGLRHAVRVAFVRLYEDGLIYRGERIINWCPTDRTALSDSEVEHEEVAGELVTFRYALSDGSGHVDVTTTRIETMLADTGVAVHPDDDRYRDFVGRTVRHPFTGQDLPIVADEAVDRDFGTGAVKVTPAHDPTDFEIAERAGLPRINMLEADGALSDAVPEEFRGLDRYEARKRVLDALDARGLVVGRERPYVHVVGHCYRCGSEIEPWLSGEQWFVAVDRLKRPAKEAAVDGRIGFIPERWLGAYTAWLDNLRDWNISRQLWWGHRIPVWYCPNGHLFASVEDPDACRECGAPDIEQDPDVMDTWFSSQLWPFSTLGWPDRTEDLEFFYPTSVLVSGYEILYLWVARMIMSGMYLAGEIPFRHVLIHGLVRDERNRKMSKSLGNVIDPLDVIDRYGADALRYSLARLASPEQQNIPFGMRDVDAGRHFANKVWNAARLVLGAQESSGPPALPPSDRRTPVERWILSRHEACREEVDEAFEEFRFDDAARALHRFLWSELADWALEMAKPRLYEGSSEEREAATEVLAWVLERTLRLLHPIMPFITEEVWQRFGIGDSIVISEWPEPHPDLRDRDAERTFSFAEDLVLAVRSFRSGHGLTPGTALTVRVRAVGDQRDVLVTLDQEIRRVARIERLEPIEGDGDASGHARLMVQGAEVLIPLAGVLDPAAECARLRKRLGGIAAGAERAARKLDDRGFIEKAPADVVEKERAKLVSLEGERAVLEAQLVELGC